MSVMQINSVKSGDIPSCGRTQTRPKYYRPRQHLTAYREPMTGKPLSVVKEMFISEQFPRVSRTELEAFVSEGAEELLDAEQRFLCASSFSYRTIKHNPALVSFYTGLPNDIQFHHVVDMIQSEIFPKYSEWDVSEKYGFHTHSCLTFMKLRLNMTDDELAKRFGLEPYIVNMTLRLWLPALYDVIYTKSEGLGMVPMMPVENNYTKVFDFVEIRQESCSRMNSNKRKAVISVRHDGLISFASTVFTIHKPDADCIQTCRLVNTVSDDDLMQCHPEHQEAASSLRIPTESFTDSGERLIEEAANRLSAYRILMGIPTEYISLSNFIFPVCVGFANFWDSNDYPEEEDF